MVCISAVEAVLLLLLGILQVGKARVSGPTSWAARPRPEDDRRNIAHFAPGIDQESQGNAWALHARAGTDRGGKSPTGSEDGDGHAAEAEKAFRLFDRRLEPASKFQDYADLERYG